MPSTQVYAGLLNRLEHDIALDVNWRLQPTLLAFVGYQFELINYTGNEPIGIASRQLAIYNSDNRDNRSQYGYVGAQYTPLDNLNLAAQAGIQYADYYNPPAGFPQPINFLLMQICRELIPICREVMCS